MSGKVISMDARTGGRRRKSGLRRPPNRWARSAPAPPRRSRRCATSAGAAGPGAAARPAAAWRPPGRAGRRRRPGDRAGPAPADRRADPHRVPAAALRRGARRRRLPRGGHRPRRRHAAWRPRPDLRRMLSRSGRSRCSAPATSRSRSPCPAATPPRRSPPAARSSSRPRRPTRRRRVLCRRRARWPARPRPAPPARPGVAGARRRGRRATGRSTRRSPRSASPGRCAAGGRWSTWPPPGRCRSRSTASWARSTRSWSARPPRATAARRSAPGCAGSFTLGVGPVLHQARVAVVPSGADGPRADAGALVTGHRGRRRHMLSERTADAYAAGPAACSPRPASRCSPAAAPGRPPASGARRCCSAPGRERWQGPLLGGVLRPGTGARRVRHRRRRPGRRCGRFGPALTASMHAEDDDRPLATRVLDHSSTRPGGSCGTATRPGWPSPGRSTTAARTPRRPTPCTPASARARDPPLAAPGLLPGRAPGSAAHALRDTPRCPAASAAGPSCDGSAGEDVREVEPTGVELGVGAGPGGRGRGASGGTGRCAETGRPPCGRRRPPRPLGPQRDPGEVLPRVPPGDRARHPPASRRRPARPPRDARQVGIRSGCQLVDQLRAPPHREGARRRRVQRARGVVEAEQQRADDRAGLVLR